MRQATILSFANSARRSTTSENQQQSPHTTFPTLNSPSTPSRPPKSSRPPLQARDHNASIIMRASQKGAPMTSRSGNSNNAPVMMGYDKQTSGRPFMPALSAGKTKSPNKGPLTPRVAGGTSNLSTPMPRRPTRQDGTSTPSTQDISTPVSAFLSTNVTPRSGSRKSRVDSTNTTPISTPQGTPAPEYRPVSGDGLGISSFGAGQKRTGSFSPSVSDVGGREEPPNDSKFFYASDAKAGPGPQAARPTIAKSSTFFYANGEDLPPPIRSGGSVVGGSVVGGSVAGSTLGEERSQPKFFHANGSPDLNASPSHYLPPPGSALSSVSHSPSPRLAQAPVLSQQRPISPQKLSHNVSFSSLRSAPVSSAGPPRPLPLGRGQSAQELRAARRVSIESPPRLSPHAKAASIDNGISRRISIGSQLPSPVVSPPLAATPIVAIPDEQSEEGTPEGSTVESVSEISSPEAVTSPVKAGHSLEHMNELAANARRERKVLDLEITNSSLAAINRTLEREMRKQTAELRRYRRLSRSGRLSIATSTSRVSTGSLSIIGEDEDGNIVSDMTDEEEEEENLSDEDSDSNSDPDDGSLSPSTLAASDLRHRKRDEKRLQLDLSKHQQLLIDSQKMNQSLKRCLGLSEIMIGEGKKQLAYNVKVSDIELGGRVLVPEEMDDGLAEERQAEERQARLTESLGLDSGEGYLSWDGLKEDRDSGVDLDPSV